MRGRARPSAFHRSLTPGKERTQRGGLGKHERSGTYGAAGVGLDARARRRGRARGRCAARSSPRAPASPISRRSPRRTRRSRRPWRPSRAAVTASSRRSTTGATPASRAIPAPTRRSRAAAACQITCEGTLDPKSGHCYFAAGADTSYARRPHAVQGRARPHRDAREHRRGSLSSQQISRGRVRLLGRALAQRGESQRRVRPPTSASRSPASRIRAPR